MIGYKGTDLYSSFSLGPRYQPRRQPMKSAVHCPAEARHPSVVGRGPGWGMGVLAIVSASEPWSRCLDCVGGWRAVEVEMSLPPSSVIGAGVACLFHIARHTTASQKCPLPTLCVWLANLLRLVFCFLERRKWKCFLEEGQGEGQIGNGEICGGESGQSADWDAGETTVRGNV